MTVALSWGLQILNNVKHVTYIIFRNMANSNNLFSQLCCEIQKQIPRS
jgi:hypothetical protein